MGEVIVTLLGGTSEPEQMQMQMQMQDAAARSGYRTALLYLS